MIQKSTLYTDLPFSLGFEKLLLIKKFFFFRGGCRKEEGEGEGDTFFHTEIMNHLLIAVNFSIGETVSVSYPATYK